MSKAALKAEALETEISFEYRDHTFTIDRNLSVDALEALEDGKIIRALREILGQDQFAAFKADKPRSEDLTELMEAATTALGTSLGE